ncbi:MAG TPA: N4-gp56 family major capsid protein [Deltaproteobacteria bacterium]|jgi:N4-gp56 family major capsid protein|nr:N4-gp56 family major capsid protein [Deltaproteobacteria bacterium]HNS90907.1 N4-gp56 family major capsid protein [Deltaproteobacteria bacterium]HOC76983.1 N4-gp56 family major capsid protein [Deltaproteobacteria bacterium]HPA76753.1 N4-gp56 family major capsid protein [Deltaproteobacteria bacterium]HPH51771.1 N4-gp56 family major capsid protein [Deltaproteobacteria bacterium]
MELTTTTEVPAAVAIFYDRELLANARAKLFHEKFAQTRNLPSKSGDTIKFRRYGTLTTATTPLTEGVTPAGQKLSKTDLLAKVSQYGSHKIAVRKSFLIYGNA